MFLYQWCSIFHIKNPQKLDAIGRRPLSENMLFQRPHQKERFYLKINSERIYIPEFAPHFHDFSKIADLQAHSVPPYELLQ